MFGPQGSGKGTQAEKLSAFFGIPHIAPGNIFRKAVADQTLLGKEVESIMSTGHLVPDELTNRLMKERLEQEDCLEGFIVDGYPRNKVQAEALDAMTTLTHVLIIDITDDESIERISQRRVCTNCGMTYHLDSKMPAVADVCDSCGNALLQRDDDKPESIKKRLAIYHADTEPLLANYEARGILHRIDGSGSIDAVWALVQQAIS